MSRQFLENCDQDAAYLWGTQLQLLGAISLPRGERDTVDHTSMPGNSYPNSEAIFLVLILYSIVLGVATGTTVLITYYKNKYITAIARGIFKDVYTNSLCVILLSCAVLAS